MKSITGLFLKIVLLLLIPVYAHGGFSTQIGLGGGQEIRENTNINEYEAFLRVPFPYTKEMSDTWDLFTGIELGAGLVTESDSESDDGVALSALPLLVFSAGDQFNLFLSFGAGIMTGETEFTRQNLGGEFFFASKLGMQFLLTSHWGVEYCFYHQSNAGIYDYNASLNIIKLAVIYSF